MLRRTRKTGGFFLCLLLNMLLNLEGLIPAGLLLAAHYILGLSLWWPVGAAALWVLGWYCGCW